MPRPAPHRECFNYNERCSCSKTITDSARCSTCASGWYIGSQCSQPVCGGCMAFDSSGRCTNPCSGHGSCTAPGTCACVSGYKGTSCAAFVNNWPTSIQLSKNSVLESAAQDAVVGYLSVSDPDIGDTHSCSVTNAAECPFVVSKDTLVVKGAIDYETERLYTVAVTCVDQAVVNTGTVSALFTVLVGNVNERPTSILLSSNRVAESTAIGIVIGTINVVDPDTPDTHTFELVPGAAVAAGVAAGISYVAIDGSNLALAKTVDHETTPKIGFTIRATDAGGLFVDTAFVLEVLDQNEGPTGITLTGMNGSPSPGSSTGDGGNTSAWAPVVPENLPAGQEVGTLSTVDPDAGAGHVYTIISTTPSSIANLFTITTTSGTTTLVVNTTLDYERTTSLTARVRSSDAGGLFTEATFTVDVGDVNEAGT